MVTLPGRPGMPEKEYALAYPIEAVMLYKDETAKIDRARSAAKLAAGGARLTRAEKKDLRKRRKDILKEWPTKPLDEWTADDVEDTEMLLGEATAITSTLDEDAGTGDSLYEVRNWHKIGTDDFERLLLALWVGLHRHYAALGIPPADYRSELSMKELRALELSDTQLKAIAEAIRRALSRSLIARRDPDDEEPVPNAPAPAVATMPPATSPTMMEMETNAALMRDTEIQPAT